MRIKEHELRPRADAILAALNGLPLDTRVGAGSSQVGGGTLPRAALPSVTVDLRPTKNLSLADFAARLRAGTPPVVGYISGDRFRLDLRTVFPGQDETLVHVIQSLFHATNP